MDTWNIVSSMILGVIGMGYIVYGRRQMHAMVLVSGLLLCIFPYFVPHVWMTVLIGAGVMALPRYVDF